MYKDEYGRTWQGPYDFNRATIVSKASTGFGVYQLLYSNNSKEQVAYIGIATGATIRGRLMKHVTGAGNWALARLGDPSKFRFVFYVCDPDSARQIESHVISTGKPPFNVRPEYKHFIPSISVH